MYTYIHTYISIYLYIYIHIYISIYIHQSIYIHRVFRFGDTLADLQPDTSSGGSLHMHYKIDEALLSNYTKVSLVVYSYITYMAL
jgi:hypothetical protein